MDNTHNFQELQSDNPITKEYIDFMKWFKENHVSLYEKYGRNIKLPSQINGGVCVSPEYKITQEEQDMLFKIAQTYYHPINELFKL